MIRKLPSDSLWNLGIAFMGLVIIALLAMLLLPRETPVVNASTFRREEAKLVATAEEAKAEAATLAMKNAAMLWKADPERIGAAALEQVTRSAKQRGVRLVSFRPQKSDRVGDVETLPFLATVEGSYGAVRALEAGLEARENKLAVSLLQITSSNDANDTVTANIGLVAFRDGRKEK